MPLDPEAGGTERVTSLVAKGLQSRGHNCLGMLVLNENTGEISYEGKEIEDLYSFLEGLKVDIVINQIAYSEWLLQMFLDKGGNKWYENGGKIISCLHFDPKPAPDFHYFRSLKNKTAREWINLAKSWVFRKYYENRQNIRRGEIFNWIYDCSDYFVTLSPQHFKYIKSVTNRDDYGKLRAINNPLTFDGILDKSLLEQKKKVVLVCSRMDEYQKRISAVLKAWKKIQNTPESEGWSLKILGTGPSLEEYKRYVRKNNLENVLFEGRQSPEKYYREASIFLMTSVGIEGWGLTLTESIQCGVVPVVMNTCVVYGDIIADSYNGYLSHPNDADDLVRYVRKLMADEDLLTKMQSNALESAGRFNLQSTIDKWEEIILH